MLAIIIGISSGSFVILVFILLRKFDQEIIFGVILSGIAFLYVGFVWTDLAALIISSAQVVLFVFVAYYGIKRNVYILATGYFLHGLWDLVYPLFQLPDLLPPHYDLFCMSIDFTMGCYLIIYQYRLSKPA